MKRFTIAVPEAQIAAANAAMAAETGNSADAETFGEASWEDSDGNKYAAASGLFTSQPIDVSGQLTSLNASARAAIADDMGLTPVEIAVE